MLLPWNLLAVTNKSFLFVCILGLGYRFCVLKAQNCSLPSESESSGRFMQAFYSEIRLLIILLIYVTLILQSFSECLAPYNRNTALLSQLSCLSVQLLNFNNNSKTLIQGCSNPGRISFVPWHLMYVTCFVSPFGPLAWLLIFGKFVLLYR